MDADTLVRAIRAALDETERIAQAAEGHSVFDGTGIVITHDRTAVIPSHASRHIAHNDPAAVLRRVAADREIVDAHDREHYCPLPVVAGIHGQLWTVEEGPCYTLRALARGLGINPEEEEQ